MNKMNQITKMFEKMVKKLSVDKDINHETLSKEFGEKVQEGASKGTALTGHSKKTLDESLGKKS